MLHFNIFLQKRRYKELDHLLKFLKFRIRWILNHKNWWIFLSIKYKQYVLDFEITNNQIHFLFELKTSFAFGSIDFHRLLSTGRYQNYCGSIQQKKILSENWWRTEFIPKWINYSCSRTCDLVLNPMFGLTRILKKYHSS